MFALALITLLGPSLGAIILIVVVTSIPVYGRVVRTQTQSLKAHEFIAGARASGPAPRGSSGGTWRPTWRRPPSSWPAWKSRW